MHYLFEGTVILFSATFIFYLVFFGLVYYWHEKKATYIVVPLIYTFNFFLAGFLAMSIALIVIEYLPIILPRAVETIR